MATEDPSVLKLVDKAKKGDETAGFHRVPFAADAIGSGRVCPRRERRARRDREHTAQQQRIHDRAQRLPPAEARVKRERDEHEAARERARDVALELACHLRDVRRAASAEDLRRRTILPLANDALLELLDFPHRRVACGLVEVRLIAMDEDHAEPRILRRRRLRAAEVLERGENDAERIEFKLRLRDADTRFDLRAELPEMRGDRVGLERRDELRKIIVALVEHERQCDGADFIESAGCLEQI